MKRHGNLWGAIISEDNLRKAFFRAAKGKLYQRRVQKYMGIVDKLIPRLHKRLVSGTYKTSAYKTKEIYEPKLRTIYVLPFYPDRVVHHAIMLQIEPIWDKLMFYDSYSCRIGKGQHAGSRRCMEFVRQYKYCLKCDVSKFYPSVDHSIMKQIVRRKIKDARVLALLDEILDSANTAAGAVRGKNVPIGNYLSQWFGNLYMNELDTFVKHTLRVKPYLRYCDDFCLFSNDKQQLHEWADRVKQFMSDKLKLTLSKCNLFPVSHGVDFLGYRHFKDYILVRKSTAKRIKKRMKAVLPMLRSKRINKDSAVSKVASAEGWLKHANAHNFALSIMFNQVKQGALSYEEV